MRGSFGRNIFLKIYTRNNTFIVANLESSADRSYLPGYENFRAFQGIHPVAVIKSFDGVSSLSPFLPLFLHLHNPPNKCLTLLKKKIKCFDKSPLREKRSVWLTVLHYHSSWQGGHRGRDLEQLLTAKSRERTNACLSSVGSLISPRPGIQSTSGVWATLEWVFTPQFTPLKHSLQVCHRTTSSRQFLIEDFQDSWLCSGLDSLHLATHPFILLCLKEQISVLRGVFHFTEHPSCIPSAGVPGSPVTGLQLFWR